MGTTNPNGSSTSTEEPSVVGTDPRIALPYSDQLSVGVDHQFGADWALSADLVTNRGRDEILQLEANPLDPATGLRPQPEFGSVPVFASIGSSEYDALQLHFRSAPGKRWGSFTFSYTLSRTRNDHDYLFDFVENEAVLSSFTDPPLASPRAFELAVLEAVRKFVVAPALRDGRPVGSLYTLNYNFEITGKTTPQE